MARKTRERVLDVAQRLFNSQRYGNVTTAMLAEAAGISEGNLWYHFREKRAVLDALSERFLDQCARRLAIQPRRDGVLEAYADYLRILADEIREFRFLYRDQADYGEHSDVLLTRLPSIYRDTIGQFRAFLLHMHEAGLLKMSRDRIDPLAVNIVIVLRFYMEFAREAGLPSDDGLSLIGQSFAMHLSLFDGALTDDAKIYLKTSLDIVETRAA